MLLQEWERLDTGGDGLILFDTFCSWAAQWQLVDDTGRRGTGSFMGFSRKLPTLDPVYLKGGSVRRQVSPLLLLLLVWARGGEGWGRQTTPNWPCRGGRPPIVSMTHIVRFVSGVGVRVLALSLVAHSCPAVSPPPSPLFYGACGYNRPF